jgi:thioredoxin reductase (NADPH)
MKNVIPSENATPARSKGSGRVIFKVTSAGSLGSARDDCNFARSYRNGLVPLFPGSALLCRRDIAKFTSMEKVIIVGSGCAGLTAAIYAARANLSPLVLEGAQPGGQLSTTTLVENFPGFTDGIDGPQLILNMHAQAEKFGARFSYAEATGFEPLNSHIRLQVDDKEWLETESLIIASGASARWLGLENEEKFIGHGLTSCATCDGAFYRNVPVAVVGGGDSAAEESLFLTRFASKVYLIHRREKLRASRIMADRVLAHPKIEPIWNTVITRYIPDERGEMRAIDLRNVITHEERELPVACVFVAIGHDPNAEPYSGKLEMDKDGYLITKRLVESKHPGVFIAGDVADRVYKQAVTAAGAGCAAAIEAERYLSSLEK